MRLKKVKRGDAGPSKIQLQQEAFSFYKQAAELWAQAGEHWIKTKPRSHVSGDCFDNAATCFKKAAELIQGEADSRVDQLEQLGLLEQLEQLEKDEREASNDEG